MTISAKIIKDSVSPQGIRLTTLQLRYPRFIHAEFMTHRVFSRNASSSRAIPVERLIDDVIRDPAIPVHWGKNQPGMQAREEHTALVSIPTPSGGCQDVTAEEGWLEAMERMIQFAEAYAEAGYHKQIVNRILEPFSHINVVVTSTSWANFFALRRHKDAQPELHALADAMFEAMNNSEPQPLALGMWHLPYVLDEEINSSSEGLFDVTGILRAVSTARCARVSYLTHEGKPPNIGGDLVLFDRLVGSAPLHASPAEHQAKPDQPKNAGISYWTDGWWHAHEHGNFVGWRQHRKMLPGEYKSDR